jgi:hypothetical protein
MGKDGAHICIYGIDAGIDCLKQKTNSKMFNIAQTTLHQVSDPLQMKGVSCFASGAPERALASMAWLIPKIKSVTTSGHASDETWRCC